MLYDTRLPEVRMKRTRAGLTMARFVLVVVFCPWLGAADPADPEWYVRVDTWQETVRRSLDARARLSATRQGEAATVPAGVVLSRPYVIGPFRARHGFESVVSPEKDWARKRGRTKGIDLDQRHGRQQWQREMRPDGWVRRDLGLRAGHSMCWYRRIIAKRATTLICYFGSDDGVRVWLNGEQVLSQEDDLLPPRANKVALQLDAGENHLLTTIYNAGGESAYFFHTSPKARGEIHASDEELDTVWRFVERDFGSASARAEMRQERDDGIWTGDWEPGDIRTLALRYAEATRSVASLRDEASRLAARAVSSRGLAAVRKLYSRSCRAETLLRSAREIDLPALRRAVEDLTATFGERYPDGDAYLARLMRLETKRDSILEEAADGGRSDDRWIELGDEYETLRTEALLANPLVDFDRLLLIKRRGNLGLPQNWQGNCALGRGRYDNEIAVLSPVAPTGTLTTLYRPPKGRFVGDVDLHWDAGRMLFSMRDDRGRFQIWEVGVDGENLRQVTESLPDVDNYDACYLVDDKIIYGSTACFQGVPCVGGGSQVANLYRMNADGSGIRRLCFDQDHDWYPAVTNDGRVMFTRWEYSDTPHYFTRVVMSMNPDGTEQAAVYGSNSYWPNSTFYARSLPGHPSRFVGVISGHHGVPRMGELIVFDPAQGEHEADGAVQRVPGYGKKVEPIIRDQLVNDSWPRFLHPYPLSDKYFLVSCQPDQRSKWGIYLVDVFDNRLLLCADPSAAMLEPVPLRKVKRPRLIPDKVDPQRRDAVVFLSDIYAGDGLAGIPRGTVKSLRVFGFDYGYQGLANHTYIGIEGPWDVHRILGTVDVDEDGSAAFRVPANTPLAVQPLDDEGKALQLMRSWFVAMPGENVSCVGCHDRQTDLPPAQRERATKREPQTIRPWYGPARGFSFKREVQPVLDRYCVGCHDDELSSEREASPDLSHGVKASPNLRRRNRGKGSFTQAYVALQPYVRRPGPESDYHMMPPAEYHADSSPLVQMLRKGHYGVELDREAWERLFTWIDLNLPDHGTWHEFREIPRGQRERRREMRRLYEGHDTDYEEFPQPSGDPIVPIVPKPPLTSARSKIVDVDGWPFDAREAQRRQGPDARRTVRIDRDGSKPIELSMVRIPAGEFVMGDARGEFDERPLCRVSIDEPFWMSTTVITNELYGRFDPTHDSRYRDLRGKDHSRRGDPLNRPEQPVIRISWERAMAFCRWLSEETGRTFTLPTETQWEYACRAGSEAARSKRSAWGVDGMLDNVGEWTRTAYRPYPYRTDDGRDDGKAAGRKVVRGAAGVGRRDGHRAGYRLDYHWWQGVHDVGFRVVCTGPMVEE